MTKARFVSAQEALSQTLRKQLMAEANKTCSFQAVCCLHARKQCHAPNLSSCGEFTALIIGRCPLCQQLKKLTVQIINGTFLLLDPDFLKICALQSFLKKMPDVLCQACRETYFSRCVSCSVTSVLRISTRGTWLDLPAALLHKPAFRMFYDSLAAVPCDRCRNQHQ